MDITAVFDRKVAALMNHRSQIGDGDHIEPLLRQWTTAMAQLTDLPDGSLAEAYRAVNTR